MSRAVILAAGRGRRLSSFEGPKCLVPIGDEPLLAHQLRALRAVGVDEVVLVIGFEARRVEVEARRLAEALGMRPRFTLNPRFDDTNTLVSMGLARRALRGIVYCLNGDVLFGPGLAATLEGAGRPGAVAVERGRVAEEEVKLRCDAEGRIQAISKEIPPEESLGEAVGVARYAEGRAEAFGAALGRMMEQPQHRHSYYEAAMSAILEAAPLHAVDVRGEPVIEIDFPEDLRRARGEILGELRARA